MPGTAEKWILRELTVQTLCRLSLFCAIERTTSLA
jgi:hypothetical protein